MSLSQAQWAFVRHLVPEDPADRALSEQDFADLLGVTDRTLRNWKKDPEFQAALEATRKARDTDPDYFDILARHRAMEVLLNNMLHADTAAARNTAATRVMEATKHLEKDEGEAVDYNPYTIEELEEMALKRGIPVEEIGKAQLKGLVEGL